MDKHKPIRIRFNFTIGFWYHGNVNAFKSISCRGCFIARPMTNKWFTLDTRTIKKGITKRERKNRCGFVDSVVVRCLEMGLFSDSTYYLKISIFLLIFINRLMLPTLILITLLVIVCVDSSKCGYDAAI